MTEWIRFIYKQDTSLFGILTGDYVDEYEGNLFETPKPTGRRIPINEVQLQAPLEPLQFMLYGIIFMNVQKRKNRQSLMYRFTS